MLTGLMRLLFGKRKPSVKIVTLDDGCVDFVVDNTTIHSIPRKQLINSEIAQTACARNGAKVVDIKWAESDSYDQRKGFMVYLSDGDKYKIY